MKTKKLFNERKIFYFQCGACGSRRQSFLRRVANGKLCRKCRSPRMFNPNQAILF